METYREIIPMSSLSAVFQAEMMAILRCEKLLLSKNVRRRKRRSCCGSKTAIAALLKSSAKSTVL
jgi:hypothetical protein